MASAAEISNSTVKYRPDIDGMRAIAVLAVVGFHAFPNLISGGFFGVDVFFVISGFLITTILDNNLKTGKFDIIDFYAHRIRRIFPTLAFMMASCLVLGWFALLPNEYMLLGREVLAGAGFVANLMFWRDAGGYFDVAAELKPLLHLWSLGVEEQFYIVWPLILWAVWKNRINILLVLGLISAFSLIYALIATKVSPIAAFYSPASRGWELLLGASLAYSKFPSLKAVDERSAAYFVGHKLSWLRELPSFLGIALIFVAFLCVSKANSIPVPWALLPTLGAFITIAAGPHIWINKRILGNKLLVSIGLISYPLYIWHWPILTFARIMEGEALSVHFRIVAIILSFALAVVTYLLIERPLRRGKYLSAKAVGIASVVLVLGGAGGVIYYCKGLPDRMLWYTTQFAEFEWPDRLKSNLACKRRHPDAVGDYCISTVNQHSEQIILIGDSHANFIYPGLAEILPKNVGLTELGAGGCPPLANTERLDGSYTCAASVDKALEIASGSEVKSVVLASRGTVYMTGKGFGEIEEGSNAIISRVTSPEIKDRSLIFELGLRETLARLQKSGKEVVVILDVPELGFSPKECIDKARRPLMLTKKETRMNCYVTREEFDRRSREYRDLVISAVKDYANARVFDAAELFCDREYCWAIKDGQMLYRDDDHLSITGSNYLAKQLVKVLKFD